MYAETADIAKRGRPRKENPIKTKRYNLVLPDEVYAEVKAIADNERTSVLEAFKRVIRHGLLMYKIMKDPQARLIIRQGETEREIILA